MNNNKMETHTCCCVKLRTLATIIGLTFLVFQGLILAAVCFNLEQVNAGLAKPFEWLANQANSVGDVDASLKFISIRNAVLDWKFRDFVAIPITVSIVLIISNVLLIWSVKVKQRILLWPWLVLHFVEWFIFVALLIWTLIIMPQTNFFWHFKVITFLVVCPFLVVMAFCWFAIVCFFNYLRDLYHKEAVAAVYNHKTTVDQLEVDSAPATVYSTGQSHPWDHPLPIWSQQSQVRRQEVLDPEQLRSLDPRYNPNQVLKARSTSSSGKRQRWSALKSPTVLPDGTLIVPIADETGDDLTEIEEEEVEDTETRSHSTRAVQTVALSEDGRSVVTSLSDKFRQQDEVEVFEEFYSLPPRPIPPPPEQKDDD